MSNTTAPEGFTKNPDPDGEFWDGPKVSVGGMTLSTHWDADTKTTVTLSRQNAPSQYNTSLDDFPVEELYELQTAIGVLLHQLGELANKRQRAAQELDLEGI